MSAQSRLERELFNIRDTLVAGMPMGDWNQFVINFRDNVNILLNDLVEDTDELDVKIMNRQIETIRDAYVNRWYETEKPDGTLRDDDDPVPAGITNQIREIMNTILRLLRLRFSGGGRARLEETLRGCGMSYLLR